MGSYLKIGAFVPRLPLEAKTLISAGPFPRPAQLVWLTSK